MCSDADTSDNLSSVGVRVALHHGCSKCAIMTYAIVRTNSRRYKHGKPYMLSRVYPSLDDALLAALELSMANLRFTYQIVGR